jgi:transcriptional regulator with XRE-family HTH domain
MADARSLITGEQCRTARLLLRLSQEALARRAQVHPETVAAFENGRPSTFPMQTKVRRALVQAGIEFTGGEPGVRLKKVEGQ